jgi:3-oxoadipate enol-lactonase
MKPISSKSMKNAIEAVLSANSILVGAASPLENRLPSICIPTIVAGGDEDTALPLSASQEIYQRIDNSTYVEIEQCGHSSSIEQPKQVTQLLEQLLVATNGNDT